MYLAVGLISGTFLLLDSKIERSTFGGFQQPFTFPTLGTFMSPRQSRNTVINIKFSNHENSDYFSVSYNNEFRQEDIEEDHGDNPVAEMTTMTRNSAWKNDGGRDLFKKDPSFVLIFVRKDSPKNPGLQKLSTDPYVKLVRIVLPK